MNILDNEDTDKHFRCLQLKIRLIVLMNITRFNNLAMSTTE